jgi:hypothetical protein
MGHRSENKPQLLCKQKGCISIEHLMHPITLPRKQELLICGFRFATLHGLRCFSGCNQQFFFPYSLQSSLLLLDFRFAIIAFGFYFAS